MLLWVIHLVVPGFTTSLKTRPLIIAKFEEFIRNKVLTIYSKRLANELDTFIWKNGRPEAQRGYNDDFSYGRGHWLLGERYSYYRKSDENVEYKKAFLNSITTSRTNVRYKGNQDNIKPLYVKDTKKSKK